MKREKMNEYMVLVVPSSGCVFVKELEFFREQGGFKDNWGRNWKKVTASSIEDARKKGCNFPGAKPYHRQA